MILRYSLAVAAALLTVAASVPAQDTVVVYPDSVRVPFALGRPASGTWDWYRRETESNRAEYSWQVSVSGDTTFVIGFFLFKRAVMQPDTGTFTDLLSAGQASVGAGERISRFIRSMRPKLWASADTLYIELHGAEAIRRVFRSRPATVDLVAIMPDENMRSWTLPMRYSSP